MPSKRQNPLIWRYLLAVAEQLILLLASLDGRAAKLNVPRQYILIWSTHRQSVSYLGDQDAVTDGNAHGYPGARPVEGAGPDGQDLCLVELLDARLGQEDAAGRLGLGLDALDEDSVQEGHEGADGANRGGLFL